MLSFSLNPSWCTSTITSEPIFSTPNYNNDLHNSNNNNNNNNIPFVEPFVYHNHNNNNNNNTALFPYQSHGITSNYLPNTYYNTNSHNNYYYHEQTQSSNTNTATTKKKPCSDRHSKIAVRNRLRHRRTRLSIDVARQLFELQDMLKFERASKAVGWLLVRAKPDILKLKQEVGGGGPCSINSDDNVSSDYELALSGIEDEAAAAAADGDDPITGDGKGKSKRKYRRASEPRKAVYMSKEAREVARKRARERTLSKQTQRSMAASNVWVEQVVPQQVGGGVSNLVLPDDLFLDVGMLFEMVA